MADGTISDLSITASSYERDYLPEYARLGSPYLWSNVASDSHPWIQVDLGFDHRVTGFQAIGSLQENIEQSWQMIVQFGKSELDLKVIRDEFGLEKVFTSHSKKMLSFKL